MKPASQRDHSANEPSAHRPRDAAAVFVGTAVRCLRRVIQLRQRGAPAAKSLHQAKAARDALDGAIWAFEYEAGLRERGEK